jgi:hypothetical protein
MNKTLKEVNNLKKIIKNTISEQVEKISNYSKIDIKYVNYPFIRAFQDKDFDERKKSSEIIMKKHPESIPIIVDCKSNIELNKKKYIVPKNLNMSQFMSNIRKKINIDSSQSIFLLCNNTMISNNQIVINVYNKHHHADGFLYIILTLENVFGN